MFDQPDLDPGGVDEIPEEECWRLLASRPVGRFAVMVGDYPLVFPVNHTVVARGVVFRSAPGSKLWSIHRSNVSFEVDEIDERSKSGWSVILRGAARELTVDRNPELLEAVKQSWPQPWAPGPKDRVVRIVADAITGRRIRPIQVLSGDELPDLVEP
jgi:nitroimidazol reductase NimA-like FMN-containing flavoprotein (pyridoxamine 5'-phosphate oxidase superfamily)